LCRGSLPDDFAGERVKEFGFKTTSISSESDSVAAASNLNVKYRQYIARK